MCCGRARQQSAQGLSRLPRTVPGAAVPAARQGPPRAGVSFEYVGRTSLTVVGPYTGLHYRFDRPGARSLVDPRDRASVAAIRALRQVPRVPGYPRTP